jgi:hypothetical protein
VYVTIAALTALGAGQAVADEPAPVGVRDFSEEGTNALFWHGGDVGSELWHTWPYGALGRQDCENSPCFSYQFEVRDPGVELRVGIDVPERVDEFELRLDGPDGSTRTRRNPNRYNSEILVGAPPVGTWTVHVRPINATDTPFGLRAGLLAEPHVPTPDEDGLLLPNLRMTPPFEFGFVAPANPSNGLWPPDNLNPPLSAAGLEPLSCAPDETAEDGAVRCLRFSFGLENAGEGNFDIRYTSSGVERAGPAWQCVEQADGPPLRREAGSWEYHWTHGHDHYHDIVEHQLLRVVDPEAVQTPRAGRRGREARLQPRRPALRRLGPVHPGQPRHERHGGQLRARHEPQARAVARLGGRVPLAAARQLRRLRRQPRRRLRAAADRRPP